MVTLMTITIPKSDGQTPRDAPLSFEVASIKPLGGPFPSGSGPWIVTHGRFKAEAGYVRGVVGWAYDVLPAVVKGGPGWIDTDPYIFDARAENSDASADQVRGMLQTLLTERFKLVVHRATQQGQVYSLVVGKNGSKMQKVKDGRKPFVTWTGPGQVTFAGNRMQALISVLSSALRSPVLDETGLEGLYAFSLEFTDPRDPRPRQADSRPDIFTALQEQLGLKLEAKKGPVEILVIDHIERPSEN